jgi:hypothetical protein
VVWTGRFEKFLEMVLRRPRLALEVSFGGHDTLLATVAGFLTATAIANHYGDTSRMPLVPLLAALGTLPSTLTGGPG